MARAGGGVAELKAVIGASETRLLVKLRRQIPPPRAVAATFARAGGTAGAPFVKGGGERSERGIFRALVRPLSLGALWSFVFQLSVPAHAAAAPRVVQFSPQGTVKNVRQVTAHFSAPMVPLGDPRLRVDPFTVECSESGSGRWVDSASWVYDFARDVPAGVRCAFRIRDGLKTLSGEPIAAGESFAFSTGGPAVKTSVPFQGDEAIDEEQAFVLVLDGEATETSVLAHAYFAVEGVTERVGVRVLAGEARETILRHIRREHFAGPTIVLQARQRFPNGTKVSLVWGAGIAAPSGIATEKDQILDYQTRNAFSADLRCVRENANANCVPLTRISLAFTARVTWEQASEIVLVGPDGRRWSPQPPEGDREFVERVDFAPPFPESATLRLEIPPSLHDDAGRGLMNASDFPLTVKTDPFPPLAKFAARFGIIEWKAEPALPVTLRNLEPDVPGHRQRVTAERESGLGALLDRLRARVTGSVARIPPDHPEYILPWLRRVGAAKRTASVFDQPEPAAGPLETFSLPKPNGAKAFEVVGIPLTAPGLYIVELASPRLGAALLGKEQPMYVPTAALVSNMAVHFKWGRERSLAWVTTLEDARPVANAHVQVLACNGTVQWTGETDAQGIAWIDSLPPREQLPTCYERGTRDETEEEEIYYDESSQTWALDSLSEGLLVVATTAEDVSFVHSSWSRGIEPWRFQLPDASTQGPVVAHTIFDRTLFRSGDTVHMKHILRVQTLAGFALVPEAQRPTVASIRHQGSDEKYELPLDWDAGGAAESTWTIPRGAKLGRYQVVLMRPGKDSWRTERVAGSFRVEEFRVPLMRATVELPAAPQVGVSEVPVDLSAQYLSGGGAGKLPVIVRAQVRPKDFRSADFEGFTFANGPVKEGIIRESEDEEEQEPASARGGVLQRQELVLDAAGTARTTITGVPPAKTLRELLVELEFHDPNGERQTVSSTVPLWPAARLVGIKSESFSTTKDHVRARVAVVDLAGHPVSEARVRVDVLPQKFYSHRTRLVGGFYAYEHVQETGPVAGQLCAGETDARGLLLCDGASPVAGDIILQASLVDDPAGTSAYTDCFVTGETDFWFRAADSDRIDVLPEKARYEPGETARLQVRMPFRDATALVTLEREGVLEASIVALSGKDPVVEVPIKETYAPNMFVSVLVVRGRVGGIQPTATVDLGRPAWKLGVAELRVGWRAHELKVAVTTDQPVYRVRARANVRVAVRTAGGQVPPPGSEVALAAVDEGLLELQPNTSWDLLEAMMGRRGYAVRTATAQMQVVGKRHFGLKALPQGGGGGKQSTRELFDTLLLWQARVPLDASGEASVEVPLNDSLTSFRIVAVATAAVDEFGTGAATIRSTQDLMLLPGVAPLARIGDRFAAEFTVRNTTDHDMSVTLAGTVDGLDHPLEPRTVMLAAGEAKAIEWNITVPTNVSVLRYEVDAREPAGASDRVAVTQQVRPAVPARVYQATLQQIDRPLREEVERPADALPDQGGVEVDLAAAITTGLDGVRTWMRDYPYSCLEQGVSRAVALQDDELWRAVSASLPSYADKDGLLKYFPDMRSGSEVLTAYVLAITRAAGRPLPTDVEDKMVNGLRGFLSGTIVRTPIVSAADLSIRKLMALDALARAGKADAALADGITIEPNLWPTSALLDWWDVLRRVDGIPDRARRLQEAEQIVRARLNVQGTTIGFSTDATDGLWWLMVCPDTNAVRLVLDLVDAGAWQAELPRIARGALGRQRRGHWQCTITNAWGTVAIDRFSQAFEKTGVTGTTTTSLGGTSEKAEWTPDAQQFGFSFPWPSGREVLALAHGGTGAPWATVQLRAAIPLTAQLSSGYRIAKTITPVEARVPGRYSRGDILRVRLEIEAQSEMTWVVVDDPIPAGASHLGTGLGRDSQIITSGEAQPDEIWPAFEERALGAFRAYYDFVPKATFTREYTIRLNQAGTFALPATRVEALYAPDMFGELPNAAMEVEP